MLICDHCRLYTTIIRSRKLHNLSQTDDCRNKDSMKPVVADKHSCY